MIEREFDEATGIILVRGAGLYSVMDIEQHYVALRELVERVGRRPSLFACCRTSRTA